MEGVFFVVLGERGLLRPAFPIPARLVASFGMHGNLGKKPVAVTRLEGGEPKSENWGIKTQKYQ